MKCLAIGKRCGDGKITWYTPRMVSVFFKPLIENMPATVLDALNNLQSGHLIPLPLPQQKYAYALNFKGNTSLIIADSEITDQQMLAVHTHIFTHKTSLEAICKNFDHHCSQETASIQRIKDPKTAAALQGLEEVKEIMKDNIEKAIARKGQLEQIEEKTKSLEMQTKIYREQAAELNSCWPTWTSYCSVL